MSLVFTDSCKVGGLPEITSNPNTITAPENIFYLELVQLLLSLATLATTILLPRIQTQVSSTRA